MVRDSMAYHQTTGTVGIALVIMRVTAGVADVRAGKGYNLASVGRVRQNFLITGHGGIKTDYYPQHYQIY